MTQKSIQEVKRLDYLKREVRLDIIRQDLLDGKTHEEIARELSFSRSTLERDLRHWRASGGFEDWVEQEFLNIHREMKVKDCALVYKVLATLLSKTIRNRSQPRFSTTDVLLGKDEDDMAYDDRLLEEEKERVRLAKLTVL